MKKVLITGITGQGDSYPAELLLQRGYEVHGMGNLGAVRDWGNAKEQALTPELVRPMVDADARRQLPSEGSPVARRRSLDLASLPVDAGTSKVIR